MTADKIHDQAMALVDRANHLRRLGDVRGSANSLRKAFLKEKAAAEMFAKRGRDEIWRSVLHRSAATLALRCGEYREAERLIAAGLVGNPPQEIADELRDLLQNVYFEKPIRQKRRPIAKTAQLA